MGSTVILVTLNFLVVVLLALGNYQLMKIEKNQKDIETTPTSD